MFSKLDLFRKPPIEQTAGVAIITSMPHAVLALDKNNRVSYLNPAAEKLFDIKAATGQPLEIISASLAVALQEARDAGESNVEYQAEDHGLAHYFEAHVSVLVNRHGRRTGWVVMVSDITEQKTLEMPQARSERFQILFDKSPDAVVLIDPHSQGVSWAIIDCNPAFCRMNSFDRNELIGQSIDIVHEGPDSASNRAAFFRRLREKGTIKGTIVHRRKDGAIYHIQYVTSLFTFEGRELVLGIDRDITERIKIEQTLRESEERYRSVTEQNLAGVYVIQDGKFRYVNPALARILGYSPEEIIDRLGPEDVVHPEDTPRVREKIRQRIEGETEEAQYQFRTQRASGEIVHCEALGRRATYEGRPAVLGTLLDITEHIQVEQALIQHVGQLELINQVSREYTAELSPDALLDKAARLIQESFGYPHVGLFLLDEEGQELVMKARAGSYAALFPPDHRLKLDKGINGWVARNGQRLLIGDVRADARYYNPFPEQLIRSELSVPVKWGDEVVGVLDIQSDQLDAFGKSDVLVLETLADQLAMAIQNAHLFEQTQIALLELAEAEQAIRAERDRAQQYLDVAGAIMVALDRDEKIILINRKGCEVLGCELQEITGQNWFDLAIPEHNRVEIKAVFQQLMVGQIEGVEQTENVVVTRQGEERLIEWRNTLLRDDDGQITGTLSSGIDVTERRQAEQALRESEEQYRNVTEQNLAGVYIVQEGIIRYANPALARILGYTTDELIDQVAFKDLAHPDDLPTIMKAVQPRIEGEMDEARYQFRAQRRSGEIAHCEVLGRRVMYESQPAILGTLLDITEQRRAARREQLAHEVALELARSLDTNQLLKNTIERLHTAFEYYSISIFLLDEDSGQLVMAAGLGEVGAELIELEYSIPLDAERSLMALAARTIEPTVANDVREDPYHLPNPLLPKTISMAVLPLAVGQKVLGVLDIQHTVLNHFTQQEINTLQIVANQLAIALSNARSFGKTEAALADLVLAEKAVRAERDRAQQYLDVAGAIIVALDSNQCVTLLNRKGCEVLGYELHEITGQNWFDITLPEHVKQPTKAIFQQLMDGQVEQAEHTENAVVTRQGEERIVEWRNALLRDDDGQITGTLSSGIDVTERRRAEQESQQRRSFLEGLLAAAPDAIVTLDDQHQIVEWNPGAEELFGYTVDEARGRNIDSLIARFDDVAGEAAEKTRMVLQGQALSPIEAVRYRKDGLPVAVILAGSPILVNEALLGVVGVYTDITDLKRAEAAEREQRILAEVLRDNAAIINSTLDLDDVLERVLENVVRVVGYDAADILLVQDGIARIKRFKGYAQYVTEEEIQKIVLPVDTTANLRRMTETQQPDIIPDVSRETGWIFSSTYAWARGYIGAPIILNNEIFGFISLINKQPNVYQPSDAERLQAFANQAAIAIRNAQLYEQMNRYASELEVNNERLAAYGHTMAHDLKNPLNTLLMAFEIILAEVDQLTPATQKFTRQSQKLIVTMSRTIDGLLRFAELREDQAEIEVVDMGAVIEDVLAQLMKLIMDRGVRFEIASDLPDALGYTPWIQEVFANLISNAVKYIGQDNPDPLITIRGRLQDNIVRYEIEDNGVGIEREDQEKLFETFSRFHKSEASGHGLGLSIVQSIVHKLNGELGVESFPGDGSTFWFTLPAPPS